MAADSRKWSFRKQMRPNGSETGIANDSLLFETEEEEEEREKLLKIVEIPNLNKERQTEDYNIE